MSALSGGLKPAPRRAGSYTNNRDAIEALKAVARKRLKVIYAIMRDRVPYSA